jgi:hypothetical protein
MISRLAVSCQVDDFGGIIAFYVVAVGTPVWTNDSCIPDQLWPFGVGVSQ